MSTYTDASLILYPSGYKEDKLYSLKPTDGSGDLTFTRASTATRVNAEGLIETSPVNLLSYSEDFSNGVWTALDATITTNAATAPNGTTTADKIDLGTLIYSQIAQTVTNIKGAYNFTLYIRSLTGTQTIYSYAYNDVDGLVLSTAFSIGTSWTQIEYNFTVSKESVFGIRSEQAIAKSFYIWGAQLNIGATAKTYFPTTDRLNVPRIDYTGGGCGSLLLEKQSTNLATYSSEFDNADWSKYNATITANVTISPDGTINADKYLDDTANDTHNLYKAFSISGDTTFSIYVKSAEYTRFAITNLSDGGDVLFNLSTVAVISTSANFQNGKIDSIGNGWYRVSATTNGTSGGKAIGYGLVNDSGATTFVGTGSKGVFIWGAQVEASSYPTSYIPCPSSSSVTRLADSASKTGISSLIGQTEGTVFFESKINGIQGGDMRFQLSDGTSDNWIFISPQEATGTGVKCRVYINNGNVNQVNSYSAYLSSGVHKYAFAYKENDIALYIDGVQILLDTSATIPSCNTITLNGSTPSSASLSVLEYNQAQLYTTRLTNAELATLTTI